MLEDYKNIVDAIAAEIITYEVKPTKTGSARIRKLSLQLGKHGASLRAYMVKQDKGS